MRSGSAGDLRQRRADPQRVLRSGRRQGATPSGRHRERRAAQRPGRGALPGARDPERVDHAAVPARRRKPLRNHPPHPPGAGSAPLADAGEPDAALPGLDGDAPLSGCARLHRHRDPDAHQVDARRRARLPRAVARQQRHVLCAAAVAAALQAAADGRGLRPLLPDRQVLPRRGPARRPAAGVHADRLRNLVPRRAGDQGHLRGDGPHHLPQRPRRQAAGPVPGDELPGSDAPLRFRQAGHAGQAQAHRAHRRDEGGRVQGLLGSGQLREGQGGRVAHSRRRRHEPQRDRCLHPVRRHLRRARPRLHQGQRGRQGTRRPAVADRQEPARRRRSTRSSPAPGLSTKT